MRRLPKANSQSDSIVAFCDCATLLPVVVSIVLSYAQSQDLDMSASPNPLSAPVTTMRLLRTKLFVPQAHPDLVARPRLLEALERGCHRRLTLLSAPAGFGKSTLLAVWAGQRAGGILEGAETPGRPQVGWVSLDERDNDPIRFWSYVIEALDALWPGRWATVRTMIGSPQPPPIEGVLTEMLNTLTTCEGSAALVLDDYHAIVAPAIHEGMSFLLENLPPHLCLILSGRADPPLPLAQLRARRQLVEIRAHDLRFTQEESADFLNRVMGLALRADDVSALASLTEGWAAGLQLAALSIQEAEDVRAFVASFSGEHRYIFDYLAHEILDQQPLATREFLLRTAVLDRMNGTLCDAVTGSDDGQAMLQMLERGNLFVTPLDQERHWYRYHHLFSEFLRTQLAGEKDPAEIADLHHRAAQWFVDQGDLSDAIDHALAAGDYVWAKTLVEGALVGMFRRSELRTLIGWLERLPKALIQQDAYLTMAAAWAYLATGRQEAVETRLCDVERLIGAVADGSPESYALPPEQRGPLAEISCLRATLCFNKGDLAAVEAYSRQTRAYLADDAQAGAFNQRLALLGIAAFHLALAKEFGGDTVAAVDAFQEAIPRLRDDDNPHLLPMSISHLGQLLALQGRLHDAASTYAEALREVEQRGTPSPLSGTAYTGLGSLFYEWNDLERAAAYLEQGVEMGRPWSHWEVLVNGYVGLACIDLAGGDVDRAMGRLASLVDYTTLVKMRWALPLIEAYRALFSLRIGRIHDAIAWARGIDVPAEGALPFALEPNALILARILSAQGQYAAALALLTRLAAGAEAAGRLGRVIEALSIQALVLDAQGERAAALTALANALELAAPQGYVRLFVDEGPGMRSLLAALPAKSDYASGLLAAFAGTQSIDDGGCHVALAHASDAPDRQDLAEPLTERELEILVLMADGLTNQDIADRLFISINTVKTHAKNIYSKLDVRNRAQAIVRAAEAGLL